MYQKIGVIFSLFAALTTASSVNAAENISEAIKAGEVHLDFRARIESVDQDSPADLSGNAFTLRSRLNYQTDEYLGITVFVEVDNVSALDDESYNSTTNGQATEAVIADPEGTELNQAWMQYSNWDTKFIYGRQRINLDNQRFIGGVAFRQNEQTFDGISISNSSFADTEIFYARVTNVNRIFGADSAGGDHKSDTNLLNLKFSGLELGTLSTYLYSIDNDDFARFSTDTYGVRFTGSTENNDTNWGYSLEYASQKDSANNPLDYRTNYLLLEGSATISATTFILGYELLGSDDGNAAFITPLATLHKFQGWTDQFLATPNGGVADVYASVGTTISGVKLTAVYHNFSADEASLAGDDDLGNELGFNLSRSFGSYGLDFKYASYKAGDGFFGKSDTNKAWLTATAKF